MSFERFRAWTRTLRARLMLWDAAAVFLTAVAVLVGVREGVRYALFHEIDEALLEDLDEIQLLLQEPRHTADESLFADERVQYGHSTKEASAFIHHLAHLLDLKSRHIMPAYEDAWYYMWRERRLPSNVDPLKSKLEDKEERARLSNIFDHGLIRDTLSNDTKSHVTPPDFKSSLANRQDNHACTPPKD